MNIYKLLTLSLKEKIGRLQKQTYNFKILACEYGQWRTVRDWDCRDVNGDEMPWYTYPAFEFLSHLDLSSFRVFEFGSGNSTIWWAKQARFVHSVENDTKWFEHVNLKIKVDALNSVTYELKNDKKTYLDALNQEFDITIIDGKYRSDCTEQYFEFSKNGFMLIFDNSDWYPDSIKKIREKLKWLEIDFHGFGPINSYTWTTTIFINPKMIEKIIYKKNLKSISGLNNNSENKLC